MPHPPVQRGMKMVEEALRAQGHEIIEFEEPDSAEADRLTVPKSKLYTQIADNSLVFGVSMEEKILPIHVLNLENLLFQI